MTPPQTDGELDTVTIPFTTESIKAVFGWLLMEMRSVAKFLRPDERDVLRRIMSHPGRNLTVRDLFPAFEREGEAHTTLRRLRATQFIYPKRTGSWYPDEPVAVAPFARMVWDHLGEARIFSPPPAPPVKPKGVPVAVPPSAGKPELNSPRPVGPKAAPVDARTPPPQQLAEQPAITWENLLERIRERQREPGPGSTSRQS